MKAPEEILLLLQETVQTRLLYEATRFELEKALDERIGHDAEMQLFALGAKDEVTLEDAARFLEIVRRDRRST